MECSQIGYWNGKKILTEKKIQVLVCVSIDGTK